MSYSNTENFEYYTSDAYCAPAFSNAFLLSDIIDTVNIAVSIFINIGIFLQLHNLVIIIKDTFFKDFKKQKSFIPNTGLIV